MLDQSLPLTRRNDKPHLMHAEVHHLGIRQVSKCERPVVAVRSAPEDGEANLSLQRIEPVLTAVHDRERTPLPGDVPLHDHPPPVRVLLPVRRPPDGPTGDLAENLLSMK